MKHNIHESKKNGKKVILLIVETKRIGNHLSLNVKKIGLSSHYLIFNCILSSTFCVKKIKI